MSKLALNLDDLNVTTFAVNDTSSTAHGTVHGQADDDLAADNSIFNTCGTFDINCGNSCGLYYCDSDESCGGRTTIGTIEIE